MNTLPPAGSAQPEPPPSPSIEVDYFDGISARPRRVRLRIDGRDLHITADDGFDLRVPVASVQWPERTRHGPRVAHLQAGGSLQALDAQAWDDWRRATGTRESLVVRAQQNWRSTALAVVLLLLSGVAAFEWGLPWLARAALRAVPPRIDAAIGDVVWRSLEGSMLKPSEVPAARQAEVRDRFARAVARTFPNGGAPRYELRFQATPKSDGPNAFALPGGTIVVTDEMLKLLKGSDDVLIGVLGHELGHVRARHGMRLLLQASVIAMVSSLVWGDFSSVLAAAPVLLGQSAYSRDFERDADTQSIELLRANGIRPAVMAELFERLAAFRDPKRDGAPFDLGISIASHPADAERIKRFRDAG